jgi:cellulose synthase/poly-beta-1,6-N-acetylglucosamine synthase-like glycosyltransferase
VISGARSDDHQLFADLSRTASLGLVVIGRNEGSRLQRCLASVRDIRSKVYVDSGSIDGSLELARQEGALTVELGTPPPFTAARARNAGIARLLHECPGLQFLQVVDGDCEVQPGWIEAALTALRAEPSLALVFGRRRERFPERSIYNALCDDEWNVPVGDALGCGGDALFRLSALQQVGFYRSSMIAAEDTELSARLRKCGWRLRRIDAEMTVHDAAITRFRQWWRRARRSGHGFGELAAFHPDARNPSWTRIVFSIWVWGGAVPAGVLASLLLGLLSDWRWLWAAVLLLGAWVVRVARIAARQRRRGLPRRLARASGLLLMLGKLPQLSGLLGHYHDRLFGHASRLIEYKDAETR